MWGTVLGVLLVVVDFVMVFDFAFCFLLWFAGCGCVSVVCLWFV